ncbi:MAG: SAM-dependent methyltransferase [Lachnospiraceae bacterium]|uniref:tRNA (adenine(22)-N(1))-methyltransferase n=1 Tax=Candidatus Merdisoma sp. JLR.KK011 TaxID=3114299 RepID=UPI0029D437B7|nr:SAM-dependent methyltransferase [Lachnospiraceae bacterium]MCI9251411.1 SAM-dependent methyltransferase [Lachnospiraceae bacterium]MCI9622381.1 SAM-dependent methyltransferase [Lachnospiraceae bacterium]
MKLSERLERLAKMVSPGNRLVDVGTDHGYVPISLCEGKQIPSAIAMDINEGPLLRAKSHIEEAGLTGYIQTRLSDGLAALKAGEGDTVLIAGMGGILMEKILHEGRETLSSVRELILQPQSDIAGVRQWLDRNEWQIVCEDIVMEEGKYYPMMKAVQGRGRSYTLPEFRYGRADLQQSLPVQEEYLRKQLQAHEKILERLPKEGKERTLAREYFVQRDIRILKEALKACVLEQQEVVL